MNRSLHQWLTVTVLAVGCAQSWAQAAPPAPVTPTRLTGTWLLCDDPDHGPKDALQFNADGTGLVLREKGNIELMHRIAGQKVQVLANGNGYAVPIEFSASGTFDELFLYSSKTKNTSRYVRETSDLVKGCTVK